MKRIKSKSIILLVIAVLLIVCSISCINTHSARAESIDVDTNYETEAQTDVESRLFTALSLNLTTENKTVYARVRNDFTLFSSTVIVYVYLYSSNTYSELVENMTLEDSNYISDLNIYETVSASKAINGTEKYWRARTRYKIDNDPWAERATLTYRIDSVGTIHAG